MDDLIVWIIIIAFYAPLHYLLPVLVLFITGNEPEELRQTMIRRALIDSTLSMVAAFAIAIALVLKGLMIWAMLILMLSMTAPFIRIVHHRKDISG